MWMDKSLFYHTLLYAIQNKMGCMLVAQEGLTVTPWIVAHQASLAMKFSWQDHSPRSQTFWNVKSGGP